MTFDDPDMSQFKITSKEVWRDLNQFRSETREETSQIREMLSSIDSKLDVMSVTMTHATKSVEDHELRIRQVEKHTWQVAAVAGFLGSATALVFAFFMK